jgi:hypothetical protein
MKTFNILPDFTESFWYSQAQILLLLKILTFFTAAMTKGFQKAIISQLCEFLKAGGNCVIYQS